MDKKNILIISYYYKPFQDVGVLRTSYWCEELNKKENIFCNVITAVCQDQKSDNIFYVKDTKRYNPLSFFINDKGLSWRKDLKDFIYHHSKQYHYDTVIFSGGPFLHFSLISLCKRVFKCKVILDFRDPFSFNPRFNNNLIKVKIKQLFERRYINLADHVITVNSTCLDLITLGMKTKNKNKYKIIKNGFSDTAVINVINSFERETHKKTRLIYSGKFYSDFNTDYFFRIISSKEFKDKFEFYHIGKKYNLIKKYNNNGNIFEMGYLQYEENLKYIYNSDIGCIFTGGKEFESTTKLFDYVGLKKPMLIITEGEIKTGNIHKLTHKYPNVYWSKNNYEDIKNTLSRIIRDRPMNCDFDNYKYSRRYGLDKLVEVL